MEKADREVNNSNKRQTGIIIGIAMILLSVVIAYFAISMPRISYAPETTGGNSVTGQGQTQNAQTNPSANQSSGGANAYFPEASVQYPLNLNTCTAAELMTINNIGEARANAIIAYRDYLGGYTSVDQLKNISGIGDAIFASIEPYVTV